MSRILTLQYFDIMNYQKYVLSLLSIVNNLHSLPYSPCLKCSAILQVRKNNLLGDRRLAASQVPPGATSEVKPSLAAAPAPVHHIDSDGPALVLQLSAGTTPQS